ncbi:MAG: hypothetical protein JNG90_03715 [Planctomycetaceae bacterium]|nr:hypothetical protein [Planctomycetaceae bacterium]
MGRFSSFLTGAAVGAGLMFGGLTYHVVRTTEGYELVPKISAGFADTYIDVRTFGVSDWANHKPLVAAIVRADKKNILEPSSAESLTEGVQDMLQGLGHVPSTKSG